MGVRETAERTAHTVKGTASTLGIQDLAERAGKIEAATARMMAVARARLAL